MDREAENKIAMLLACDCEAELRSMWSHLPPEMKARADVLRAKDTRKADLIREQKEAA